MPNHTSVHSSLPVASNLKGVLEYRFNCFMVRGLGRPRNLQFPSRNLVIVTASRTSLRKVRVWLIQSKLNCAAVSG